MDKRVDKEAKSQEHRLRWAIFLSVILHIILVSLLSNFGNEVPNEQSKVITVRLVQDNLSVSQEKSGNNKNSSAKKGSAPPKKETDRKNADNKKTVQKPTENKSITKKNSGNIEKKQQPKESDKKIIEKQNNSQFSEEIKPIENTTTTTEEDIFNKIETSQREAKQQLEKDFFENSQADEEALPDFDFSDILLADNSASDKNSNINGFGESNNKNKDDNNSGSGKDIEWSNGGSRGLLHSDAIEVPDEVKKAGLKFKIEIDFDVDPDGYIRNANILKSSGNSLWDEEIRRQFCKWLFEKSSKQENSSGKIIIAVGY